MRIIHIAALATFQVLAGCGRRQPPPAPTAAQSTPTPAPVPELPPRYGENLPPLAYAQGATNSPLARQLNSEGLALHRAGDYNGAAAKFDAAARADRSSVVTRYNLACALARLDRTSIAIGLLGEIAAVGCPVCQEKIAKAQTDDDLRSLWTKPEFTAIVRGQTHSAPSRPADKMSASFIRRLAGGSIELERLVDERLGVAFVEWMDNPSDESGRDTRRAALLCSDELRSRMTKLKAQLKNALKSSEPIDCSEDPSPACIMRGPMEFAPIYELRMERDAAGGLLLRTVVITDVGSGPAVRDWTSDQARRLGAGRCRAP